MIDSYKLNLIDLSGFLTLLFLATTFIVANTPVVLFFFLYKILYEYISYMAFVYSLSLFLFQAKNLTIVHIKFREK